MTTIELVAVDTNILVYLHDVENTPKRRIAVGMVAEGPVVSNQVISEYLNATKRLLKVPKTELLENALEWLRDCQLVPFEHGTLRLALHLVRRYDFQLFDSLIVAAALEAGCTKLYSEDMQHGQLVENRLLILNPFL